MRHLIKKTEKLITYSAAEQILEVSIEVNKSLIVIRFINCADIVCQSKGMESHSNGNADHVNSNMPHSYKKLSFFSGTWRGSCLKGGMLQQLYIDKMFTCVVWRNVSNGAVEYFIFRNYGGKSNKTEHQDKNDKVQHDQKAQEGEVGLDASTKCPWK